MDAHNLETAVDFIRKARKRPPSVRVDIKGWVRIKRDISDLSVVRDIPYSQVAPCDKWLWHEKRAAMKLAEIRVLGIPVVRV